MFDLYQFENLFLQNEGSGVRVREVLLAHSGWTHFGIMGQCIVEA